MNLSYILKNLVKRIANLPNDLKNVQMGTGYGTCSAGTDVSDKIVSLPGYKLKAGGIIAVHFTNAWNTPVVFLNVNSTGNKQVRYLDSYQMDTNINAGDIVTFMYDGTYWRLLAIDRSTKDYVVEQSNGGNEGYTKWSSGKMEVWIRAGVTANITSSASGMYYGSLSAITYPQEFLSYPVVSITAQSEAGYGWIVPNYSDYSTKNTGTIYIYYPTSQSNKKVTINVYAVGRWK